MDWKSLSTPDLLAEARKCVQNNMVMVIEEGNQARLKALATTAATIDGWLRGGWRTDKVGESFVRDFCLTLMAQMPPEEFLGKTASR